MDGNLCVDTEVLKTVSGEVESAIARTENAFEEIAQVIMSNGRYWEGEGADAHRALYEHNRERVDEAFRRFRENVTDLREMAGFYEYAETMNEQMADELPSDVIQ